MRRKIFVYLFELLLKAGVLPNAQGQLTENISKVIDNVLKSEELKGSSSIIVGGFEMSVQKQDLHAASGLKQMIVDCLQRRNIKVERHGEFPAISGQYCYATSKKDGAEI